MPEKDLHHRITGDSTSLEGAMKRGSRALTEAEREARRLEIQQRKTHSAMTEMGRGMVTVGAAIAVGLGLAIKAAIDWESAWAGVAKTVDGTDDQLAALEDELRSLARELPATHGEIAAVAEAAGQLGVATEDISAFTETMVALGEATNLTADEAATAIAQLMNVMGTAPENVQRLASALVELGNNGASTERDIISMAQRIAGAGSIVGASETDVLALSNALASVGIEAEAGGSAVSSVMIRIANAAQDGGDAIEGFASVAGVSADDFTAHWQRDPVSALNLFVQGLGRVNAAGGDVFGTLERLGIVEIRQRDALLRLASAGDLLTQSLQDGERAWDENIALQAEVERRYQTTAARMEIARNQVVDFAISVGQVLLPVVGGLADGLGDLASLLGSLPGPVKTVLAVVAALAAGVLLLGGGLLMVVPRIAATKSAIDQLAASSGRAAVAGRLLNTAFGGVGRLLGGPWGIAIGVAVTALAAFGLAQAETSGKIEEVSETLDQQTGAITDNTRAWVANELESRGVLAAAERLGLDLVTVTDAILGERDALDQVNGALAEHDAGMGDIGLAVTAYRRELEAQGVAQEEVTERTRAYEQELNRQNDAADTVKGALGDLTGQVDAAQESTRRQAEATGDATDAMSALDPETRQLAESLGATADQAATLSDEVDALDKELDALFESVFGLQQAEDQLTESMRELVSQIEEQVSAGQSGAASLDGNSEAAINNRRAMEDLIESYGELIVEMVRNGATTDDVSSRTDEFRDELTRVARQLGINEEELDFYIALLEDIPNQVRTNVTANTASALAKIAELNRAINNMIANANRGITIPGAGGISQAHAHGGFVTGPSTPVDSVPILATGGEFVIRRSVAQANAAALAFLNETGRWPIGGMSAAAPAPTAMGGGGDVHVNLTAYSDQFNLRQVMDDLAARGAL